MDYWAQLEPAVSVRLTVSDDRVLWKTAINEILHEASFLARCADDSSPPLAIVGRCAHWLRPHQTRWMADGGFAWPSGYGGTGYSRTGLPEHDWSIQLLWSALAQFWIPISPNTKGSARYSCRIAIPARTAKHRQAAIPVLWSSGTPVLPGRRLSQIYGFRRQRGGWKCTATNHAGRRHYELAATHPANDPGV